MSRAMKEETRSDSKPNVFGEDGTDAEDKEPQAAGVGRQAGASKRFGA
jgi:hypothetical protein